VFHNTTPDLQDQERFLVSDRSCSMNVWCIKQIQIRPICLQRAGRPGMCDNG